MIPKEFLKGRFTHRKGGDPAEWPEDLRVQQFPRGEVARLRAVLRDEL